MKDKETREEGYYWIKHEDEWKIAEWCFEGFFLIWPACEAKIKDVQEIDPRRIVREVSETGEKREIKRLRGLLARVRRLSKYDKDHDNIMYNYHNIHQITKDFF
jgi:hypothetical protein